MSVSQITSQVRFISNEVEYAVTTAQGHLVINDYMFDTWTRIKSCLDGVMDLALNLLPWLNKGEQPEENPWFNLEDWTVMESSSRGTIQEEEFFKFLPIAVYCSSDGVVQEERHSSVMVASLKPNLSKEDLTKLTQAEEQLDAAMSRLEKGREVKK